MPLPPPSYPKDGTMYACEPADHEAVFVDDGTEVRIPVRSSMLGSIWRGVHDGEEVIVDTLFKKLVSVKTVEKVNRANNGEMVRVPAWERPIEPISVTPLRL